VERQALFVDPALIAEEAESGPGMTEPTDRITTTTMTAAMTQVTTTTPRAARPNRQAPPSLVGFTGVAETSTWVPKEYPAFNTGSGGVKLVSPA
jgi:hypothetical protein